MTINKDTVANLSSSSTRERKSNFYDSKYLAEYYDLWTQSNGDAVDLRSDANVYFSALKKSLQVHHRGEPYTILDVGTGTGRVLINLSDDAVASGPDVSDVELIGVDKEQTMIDRAQAVHLATPSFTNFNHVSWGVGEATSLSTLPNLSSKHGQIDLLFFAVGSISHLTDVDEPQRFFAEAATLLRPGSGRAYIPIQSDLICRGSLSEWRLNEDTWAEVRDADEFVSQLYPGVVYRQFPIHSSTVKEGVKYDKYNFQVVERVGSEERVIENNAIEISLRIWEVDKLLQWAQEAGLECVEEFKSSHEDYFVFQKV
jgi:SAM-dependent methyltransferase